MALERPRHHPRCRRRLRAATSTCCSSAPAAILPPSTTGHVFAWLRKLARRGVTIGGISGGPYILATRRSARRPPRDAPLGASAAPSAKPSRCRRGALAVRDRRQPHHLLGRHLGARHDGGADRARSWPPARRRGRRLVPAHPYPRGHGPAAHGSPAHGSASPTRSCCACSARMEGNIEAPQSRAELARIAGVSVRQLERLFRRHLGHGIHRQYSSMRLERARQLLRETTLPGARRGDRHRLLLVEPVRPRL